MLLYFLINRTLLSLHVMLPKNVAFMSFELQTFIRGWIPNFIDLFEKYITFNFEL